MKQGSSRLFAIILVSLLFARSHARALQSQEQQMHIQAGISHLAARKPLDAIREFQKAIELNPSIAEVHFYLSQAYGQTEEWPKALEHIDRAIQLDSKQPQYFNQRGLIFSRQKKFNKALPDALRAIELKPVDYIEYYYFNLALIYRDLLRPQDAMEAYQKTLLVAPKFSRAHIGLGEIYLERNLTDKAIEEFSLAASLDPTLPKAHLQLGLAEARAGKHAQAAEAFQRALELDPANHRIHYNLSMSLKRLGRDSEAQQHLEIFKKSQARAEEEEYRELQVEISKRTDLKNAVTQAASSSTKTEPGHIRTSNTLHASGEVLFREVTSQAGIHFHHINGATPEKYMPETMGSGCLFFDYNDDGWIDIFLVNGGSLVDAKLAAAGHSALFRNNADGTYSDVTQRAGLKNPGYGMGACAADYDNDGRKDLYLANFGTNVLYHNNGDGSFTDVTEKAGVGFSSWGSSCAFADINNDGYLDLFVVNYVDFGLSNNKFCGSLVEGLRSYCHPNVYRGLPNVLYRNNGNGTFTDITREAGVFTRTGKGLGIAFGDYDNDGWADAYVANDSVPNFLYRNFGNGTFSEVGLSTGVAVDENGLPKAGMGIDWGDYDNDGLLDIYVTNLNSETNTLYRNNGGGLFTDVTWQAGLGEPTLPFVGFGTAFLDYDNDGHLDIVVANGHILDNVSLSRDNLTYAQRNLLFHNEGNGTFREMGLSAGPGMALEKVSRGLAVGDVDNDGDLDLLINNCNQTADLLLNENRTRNHWLIVKLVGTRSNRDGIGTRLKVVASGLTQVREIKAGSSYQSQNDIRAHFGLGKTAKIDRLELRWPSGTSQVLKDMQADQILTIREGTGITGRGPYSARSHPARQ
jgi:tetratricopeptide (TPR) repeat protein